MFQDLPRPIIFAHRGASACAPENTLAAFRLAGEQGAPAIELDAKLSADGQVVVIHDPTLDRTTNGSGRVADVPMSVLKGLDAGSHFGPAFAGERIPTLDEVLESVARHVLINIELTNYTTPADDLVERVIAIVRRHDRQSSVMFSSFLEQNLLKARQLLPEVPRGLLTGLLWRGARGRRQAWRQPLHQALHPFVLDVTPGLLRRYHAVGMAVNVYTVNSPATLRRLFRWGVDGVFTNDPPLALRLSRRPA